MKNFDDIFSRVDSKKLPTPAHPKVEERSVKRQVNSLKSGLKECAKLLNSTYSKRKEG